MSAFCRVFVGLLLSMQRSDAAPCAQPLRVLRCVSAQRNFRRQHGGFVPVKRHRGEPGHTRDTLIKSQPRTGHTGHTGARGHTDHTDEPNNHPNPTTHPHDRATAMATAETGKKTPGGAGTHTHRSFVRSFQGPLGQTHTHMPRKGARGDTHASVACCLHKNKLRMWVLLLGSQIEVTLELSCQTRLTGGGTTRLRNSCGEL